MSEKDKEYTETELEEREVWVCGVCGKISPTCDYCGKGLGKDGDGFIHDYNNYHYCSLECRKQHIETGVKQ